MKILHFSPEDGRFGDPIPAFFRGEYHLYYTKLLSDGQKLGWGHLSSANLIDWQERADALLPDEEDESILTGSVIEAEGKVYAFYAAFNRGKSRILAAESDDGVKFTKTRREMLPMDARFRDDGTWRDPYVFFNPEENLYWMLVCARQPGRDILQHSGCIALAKSSDLRRWTLAGTLADGFCASPECPDMFKLGGEWALIYYWRDTCIRFSKSLLGPWRRGATLSPCHLDFMAAKRLWDGKRHVLFGWIPRKNCDCSERVWGGNMALPREIYIDARGEPCARFLPETDALFSENALTLERVTLRERAPQKIFDGEQTLRLRFSFEGAERKTVLTLFFACAMGNHGADCPPIVDAGYCLTFDFFAHELELREVSEFEQRPPIAHIPLRAGATRADIILDREFLEVNVNERETLVSRLMKLPGALLYLSSQEGETEISGLKLNLRFPKSSQKTAK